MAHYKRGYPRTSGRSRSTFRSHKWRKDRPDYYWMGNWPRWWDIQFHRRPKRREEQRMLILIRQGDDGGDLAWPVSNHKPHTYYW